MKFERPVRKWWQRATAIALGWACIGIGVIGGFIPVFQGWVFVVAGLIILSREHEWAHNILVKVRGRFPRIGRAIDRVSREAHRIVDRIIHPRSTAASS